MDDSIHRLLAEPGADPGARPAALSLRALLAGEATMDPATLRRLRERVAELHAELAALADEPAEAPPTAAARGAKP